MSKREKKVVQSSPLIFRLVSEGPYRGNGFKVHFNQFRPQCKCFSIIYNILDLTTEYNYVHVYMLNYVYVV